MVYLLGLTSAVLLAIGFVLQQHAAEEEPLNLRFSPYLLLDLVRRPLWLCGVGAMVLGLITSAAAFGMGPVALVEPLLAANLLFALPLTAIYHRCRVQPIDLAGAVTLIVGLAVFVVAGQPEGGSPNEATPLGWIIAFAAVAALAVAAVIGSRAFGRMTRAALLAVAAGSIFGLQDSVTQAADDRIESGVVALLTSWPPYTLLALGLVGLMLTQWAFAIAPLSGSLPALTAVEPIVGIVVGIVLFGEQLRTSAPAILGQVVGLVFVVVGVIVIGRSPLVTGEFHRLADHHRLHHHTDSATEEPTRDTKADPPSK